MSTCPRCGHQLASEIESGHEPPLRHSRNRYGFERMQPGDSVFIPRKNGKNFSAPYAYANRHPGWEFRARTCVENGVNGIRLWCVSRPPSSSVFGLPVRQVRRLAA